MGEMSDLAYRSRMGLQRSASKFGRRTADRRGLKEDGGYKPAGVMEPCGNWDEVPRVLDVQDRRM
jgi:hypothetical protein